MFSATFVPDIYFINGRDVVVASDAARLTGLSAAYIAKLCRKGTLAGTHLSTGWFVEENALRRFIAERAAKPSAPASVSRLTIDGVTFVRPRDVARKVGLDQDYICRLCREGHVDGRLISGTWFVNRESLRVFLADRRQRKKEARVALSLLRRLESQQ